jgi:hypothetical protein
MTSKLGGRETLPEAYQAQEPSAEQQPGGWFGGYKVIPIAQPLSRTIRGEFAQMHCQETFTDQIQRRRESWQRIRSRVWSEDPQKPGKGEWSRDIDRRDRSAGRKDQGVIIEVKKALRISAVETRRKEECSSVKDHLRGVSIHVGRDAHAIEGGNQGSRSTDLTQTYTAGVVNRTIELQASISEYMHGAKITGVNRREASGDRDTVGQSGPGKQQTTE